MKPGRVPSKTFPFVAVLVPSAEWAKMPPASMEREGKSLDGKVAKVLCMKLSVSKL